MRHGTKLSRRIVHAGVLASAAFLLAPAFLSAAEQKETTAELLDKLKARALWELDRVEVARQLSQLQDDATVRDQKVVEALLDVAKASAEGLRVRIECIKALGRLEHTLFQSGHFAKHQYLDPFKSILENKTEHHMLRGAVCDIFSDTLQVMGKDEEVRDKQVFDGMLNLCKDKQQALGFRIKLVDAIAGFGSPAAFRAFGEVMNEINLDASLREAVVRGFSKLLARLDNVTTEDLPYPIQMKIIGIISDKTVPNETRGQGLKACARLKARGIIKKSSELDAVINDILLHGTDPDLVVSAIDALGIIADDSALDSMEKALRDFYSEVNFMKKDSDKVRLASMKTLGRLLENQIEKPNAASVNRITAMIFTPIDLFTDPEAKMKEKEPIVQAAVFSLSYLWSRKPAFDAQRRNAIEKCLWILDGQRVNPAVRNEAVQTLHFLTDAVYDDEPYRWKAWFDETYKAAPFQPRVKPEKEGGQ
ncbi:MAG: hypothetical protein L6R28_16825 [Planctomycetes bacterium]|nr:hypothetical protein [Planctomycetota bacterium]